MPDSSGSLYGPPSLLFVLFLVVFLEVVILFVVVLFFFDIALFVFFFVEIIGDGVQVDGMRLRDLQLHFALGAAQDFALFDFIFIHVNFGATIGAANHGTILRTRIHGGRAGPPHRCIIYREIKSPVIGKSVSNEM
jgi:hypothetical protein